jgi:oxaloacetate decarboxylase alpha subunit/pyruvate carboxylase subunit B
MSDHNEVKITTMDYSKERPAAENPVKICDLTLRDGHQSLFATRGRTEDMIPVAEKMDEVGFWAVETWGGATFDTMHRFLNEDPWERLRTLRRYMTKTPFSMLLRAQNLVGYRNYADDLAEAFVERTSENGLEIFRTFDPLNDYRNFETVVRVIKKCGRHFQGCICYTMTEPRLGGDVYNIDYYVKKAKDLEAMGADSICLKDMAGLIAPYDAYEIVKALKAAVKPPIHLHSHFTSGMSPMSFLKAIEAGVDIIDTCMSPYAYRTSHAAVEPLVMTLLGTSRDTGLDIKQLAEINEILEKKVLPKYKHLLDDSKVSIIDINVLLHQTPGGMLSNLVNQLREMDALHKIDEVFKELPRVRKELGQVPLVTPTSQTIGVQTVNNVLFDDEEERYKMITGQVKDLCYGLYGKTAIPIDPELQKKALKGYERGEEPIEEIKAENELVKLAKLGKLVKKVEKKGPPKTEALRTFSVFVDDEYFEAPEPPPPPEPEPAELTPTAPAPVDADVEGTPLKAPMPGMIVRYLKQVGDIVSKGEAVVILEAMKMENSLSAPADGAVKAINFSTGDSVAKDSVLCVIG